MTIPDSGNIDELELRRQKRAAERASNPDSEEIPKTKSDLGRDSSGSGRPPRRRKRVVGGDDDGDDHGTSGSFVRLIDEDGTQLGIVPTLEAMKIAKEKGLSLHIVQPDANPPVAKITDYGRYKFEQEKKSRETKRKHHIVDVKEIKMRYKIDENDYQTKLRYAQKFLQAGDKIKVLMILRGREIQHKEIAQKLMHRFADELKELAFVDTEPETEGRSVLMILAPCVQ